MTAQVPSLEPSLTNRTRLPAPTAEAFYRMMDLLGAETVFNHADYRLMSHRALEGLAQFKEVNLFLREQNQPTDQPH